MDRRPSGCAIYSFESGWMRVLSPSRDHNPVPNSSGSLVDRDFGQFASFCWRSSSHSTMMKEKLWGNKNLRLFPVHHHHQSNQKSRNFLRTLFIYVVSFWNLVYLWCWWQAKSYEYLLWKPRYLHNPFPVPYIITFRSWQIYRIT